MDATLILYHTHTSDSNDSEKLVRDIDIRSHVTDYIAIAKALPPSVDAIFVKTDHWQTNPQFFTKMENRLTQLGFRLERNRNCVQFNIKGTKSLIVNGVETSVGKNRFHICVVGLPLDDENTYYNSDISGVISMGKRASWIAPAHIGMPFHRYSESVLRGLIESAQDEGVEIAIGYPTGYPPLYNRVAQNDLPFQRNVIDYASEFEIPLVPELDTHAALPNELAGCGILPANKLPDIKNDLSCILEADLFCPSSLSMGITISEFLANYRAFIPFQTQDLNYHEMFEATLPDSEYLASVQLDDSIVALD